MSENHWYRKRRHLAFLQTTLLLDAPELEDLKIFVPLYGCLSREAQRAILRFTVRVYRADLQMMKRTAALIRRGPRKRPSPPDKKR